MRRGGAYWREGRGAMPAHWDSCRTMTRKGGYQRRSSRSHWRSTVAGHTMMEGRKRRLWCNPARNTASWTVLPSPISSPMMPPARCVWSSHNHFTPAQHILHALNNSPFPLQLDEWPCNIVNGDDCNRSMHAHDAGEPARVIQALCSGVASRN